MKARDALICAEYRAGGTIDTIAPLFGVHRSTVSYILKRENLTRRGGRPLLPMLVAHDAGCTIITLHCGTKILIDTADWRWLSEYRFSFDRRGPMRKPMAYTQRSPRRFSLSRMIAEASTGDVVDHINGNELDNRRANLRICTRAQNGQNRAINRSSSLGYKGVSRDRKKFRAAAYLHGKRVNIGLFENAIDAAVAYDEFARANYREFACLNFAREGEQSVHRNSFASQQSKIASEKSRQEFGQ